MGLLKKWRAKSQHEKALASYEATRAQWLEECEHVDDLLYMSTHLDELYEASSEAGFSVRLKHNEHVVLGLVGSGLLEPRSGGGSYQGGSSGYSIRVAKGVRFRVGSHRGTYVPSPEVLKVIDTDGNLYMTTQRVIYTSPARNREWAFPKTVDLYHSDQVSGNAGWGATFIAVTNRQKTSGFIYPISEARTIRDRLLLALAIHDGTVEVMVVGLKEQQVELRQSEPTSPPKPPELEG